MPNPEPRIMTTAELEHRLDVLEYLLWYGNEPNEKHADYVSVIDRLTALERVQRDAERVGAGTGAATLGSDGCAASDQPAPAHCPCCGSDTTWPDTRDRIRWLGQMHATAMRNVERMRERAETAERKLADLNAQAPEAYAASVRTVRTLTAERDEARDEAGVANEYVRGLVDSHKRVETERDEAVEARKVWMEACHTAQAERDALREALQKISDYTTAGHDGSLMLCINELRAIAAAALASATPAPEDTPTPAHLDGLERAWILIANAGGGNWETQTPEWQESAARWRDEVWHAALVATPAEGGAE